MGHVSENNVQDNMENIDKKIKRTFYKDLKKINKKSNKGLSSQFEFPTFK